MLAYSTNKYAVMQQYGDTTYQGISESLEEKEGTSNTHNYAATNLNMAFWVVSAATDEAIALSDLEGYLEVSAAIVTMEVGAPDRSLPLTLRPCNATDISELLFEPDGDEWNREALTNLAPSMYCLDDPNLVDLDGQYSAGGGTFLTIAWRDCQTPEPPSDPFDVSQQGQPVRICKLPDEIQAFKQETHLY